VCSESSNSRGATSCTRRTTLLAKEFCETYVHGWQSCVTALVAALDEQLVKFEKRRWEESNHYLHLDIPEDANDTQINVSYASLVLKYPNKTGTKQMFDQLTTAHKTLLDPESRKLFDQPCQMMFGMCAKRTADGGMRVIAG